MFLVLSSVIMRWNAWLSPGNRKPDGIGGLVTTRATFTPMTSMARIRTRNMEYQTVKRNRIVLKHAGVFIDFASLCAPVKCCHKHLVLRHQLTRYPLPLIVAI